MVGGWIPTLSSYNIPNFALVLCVASTRQDGWSSHYWCKSGEVG